MRRWVYPALNLLFGINEWALIINHASCESIIASQKCTCIITGLLTIWAIIKTECIESSEIFRFWGFVWLLKRKLNHRWLFLSSVCKAVFRYWLCFWFLSVMLEWRMSSNNAAFWCRSTLSVNYIGLVRQRKLFYNFSFNRPVTFYFCSLWA